MRRFPLLLPLLLAGCGATAAPAPGAGPTPCPTAGFGAGPLAVTAVASAPPPIGPRVSPRPTALPACGPCQVVAGRVYDRAGKPVAGRLPIFAGPADRSFAPVQVGEAVDGAYGMRLPGFHQALIIRVGDAAGPMRERAWPATRGGFDFGGPATAADPDAPAYFLAQTAAAGAWRDAEPAPRAGGTVTSVTADWPVEVERGKTAPAGMLVQPMGLAARPGGGWLVADGRHQAVMAVTPAGAVSRLAGRGEQDLPGPGPTRVDGTGDAARFQDPYGLAIDAAGTAYVADSRNHAIRAVTPAGVVTTLAGAGSDEAPDPEAFRQPVGVAVDAAGAVYVVDRDVPRVRVIRDGRVTTLAGSAEPGYANGPAATARFGTLVAIAVAPDGTAYVADEANHRIRRIGTDGLVSDVYGQPTVDAAGATRLPAFDGFTSLAVGPDGLLYAGADGIGLLRFGKDGAPAWLAGTGTFGTADGPGPEARLNRTFGLLPAADGSVVFTDLDARRLRRWTP